MFAGTMYLIVGKYEGNNRKGDRIQLNWIVV